MRVAIGDQIEVISTRQLRTNDNNAIEPHAMLFLLVQKD